MGDARLSELAKSLKRELLPNHVAVIMDGNGRWAKHRGRPRVFGHRRGVEAVRSVVKAADQFGIKVLSLYAFSEENWGRPAHEVTALMTLLNTFLLRDRDELHRNNIQLRAMGRLERLPPRTLRLLHETLDLMSGNTGMVLNIGLSYGGRTEIVEACRALARRVQAGELAPQDLTTELFQAALTTGDLPEPDLLIRTSGEQRLSNFMLWEMAYAEFHFTPVHWPDFDAEQFAAALAEYTRRSRRYGRLDEADESDGSVVALELGD
jgi:undecaprenyl diphosphate synthase